MGYRQLFAGWALAAGMVLSVPAPAAFAGDGWVDELKLGVLDHDVGFFGPSVENGVDVNAEVRFHDIDWFTSKDNAVWLNDLLSPRPDVGASINTSGNTDFYYAGLVWTFDFAKDVFQEQDGFYTDLGFGGAIQDGDLNNAPPGEKALGSRALFHLSAELGYRFNQQISVSAYFEHFSNGDLASPNPGMNNAGVRLGYRF
jgi:lipid A 3-O-deacylase